MVDISDIKLRLTRQGCSVALNHLEQATSALARLEWEGASGQTRSALDALFDRVAEIRLRTVKRGGAARKELEEKGLLPDRQAKLIQAFMDYAGSGGSHAGTSSPDEAHARYLAGVGFLLIGLNLLPEIVKVQQVFTVLKPSLSDDQVITSCRTCGTQRKLSDCAVHRDGQDTVYVCRNGCQALVVVSTPGDSLWPGRGYRLGDYVIRNASDLRLAIPGATAQVLIPTSPAALMKSRPTGSTAP